MARKELLHELLIKNSAKESEYILRKEMGKLFPADFSQEYND